MSGRLTTTQDEPVSSSSWRWTTPPPLPRWSWPRSSRWALPATSDRFSVGLEESLSEESHEQESHEQESREQQRQTQQSREQQQRHEQKALCKETGSRDEGGLSEDSHEALRGLNNRSETQAPVATVLPALVLASHGSRETPARIAVTPEITAKLETTVKPSIAVKPEIAVKPSTTVKPEVAAELERLRQEVRSLERREHREREALSTGIASLDRALPEQGVLPGSLVEYVAGGPGAGVGLLALPLVKAACRQRDGLVVLVDRYGIWYPPTLAAWGISLDRLLWVRPENGADECWAIDQALRCPGVAVVWGVLGRVESRWGRRFRVAAETGRTLGVIEGTHERLQAPPLADLRLLVKPQAVQQASEEKQSPEEKQASEEKKVETLLNSLALQKPAASSPSRRERTRTQAERGWRLRVEVVRGRGRAHGLAVDLEVDVVSGAIRETTHAKPQRAAADRDQRVASRIAQRNNDSEQSFPSTISRDLVARLAHPTPSRRTARA